MRIGIYARVSSKDQSCELQLRDLRAYCAARDFRPCIVFLGRAPTGGLSAPLTPTNKAAAQLREVDGQLGSNAVNPQGKALSRATGGLRGCADNSGPAFRSQSSLEVFGVNACFCPLLPGHLWSLRPVALHELGFGWASGKSIQPHAFGDMRSGRFGSHSRLRCGFLRFFYHCCFLRLHVASLLRTGANH